MDHDHNEHENHADDHHHSGMEMYFYFSKSATVLFRQWSFNSIGGLIGTMIAIYALAFSYEALKFYRSYLLSSAICIRRKNAASGEERFSTGTVLSKSHLIQTLLHGIQAVIGYFLMLIFMTYNVWLCIAVIFGFLCGFFIFGWKTPIVSMDTEEHCA